MKDAELIYSALLRAERRMEHGIVHETNAGTAAFRKLQLGVVQAIREEIGNGIAKERPAIVKAKIGEVG